MKVVRTDNYDMDRFAEACVAGPGLSKEDAQKEADKLNGPDPHAFSLYFYKVEPDNYVLQVPSWWE